MAQATLIVADDSTVKRGRLPALLRKHLPEVAFVSVSSPEELWHALRSTPSNGILIDASFAPDETSGREVAKKIHAIHPNLPAIWVFPRGAELDSWMPVLMRHPGDFLVRPFKPHEFRLRIERCLTGDEGNARLKHANRVLAKLIEERSHDLYESDERFRLLFNTCTDGIFSVSISPREGSDRIIEANSRICHALGYPRDEFLTLLPKDLLEPHQVKYVNARLRTIATQKQMHVETVLLSRDGQKIPATVTGRHFSFTRQPYIIFLVHFRTRNDTGGGPPDLDHAYKTYAVQTGQIMYEYTIPEDKIRLTGATRQITGLTAEELEAVDRERWLHLIHTDDRKGLISRLTRATAEMSEYQIQYRVRHTSGDYRHVEDLGTVVPDESGAPYRMLGYVKDITDRVRMEQEEQLIEQEIQHSKRLESLGVLAGGIAHDFNNILAAIIGLTDMSLRELKGPPDVVEDLEESLRAAHRAKDLVKQILAFSRQTGEEHTPVFLHVIVREALGLLRASLPSSVDIIDSIDVHSGMVMANPTQMHQVVMNYCTNGVQAMSEKGGTLEVRLEDADITRRFAATHPKLHPGPYLKLTVSDKGHGIETSNIKRIFDPFYTTKGPGEGTGMGLAMVYGIVADHGGAILVESAVGQGTEITTYLPRTMHSIPAESGPDEVQAFGRESVLIVDDEHAIRRFCQRSLTQLGYRVQATGEPHVALADFKRDPGAFDLVITDQHMPGMTGDALAKRIKKLRPDIPIILFTGFSSEVSDEYAREAGISEIVPKPILASQLTTAIRRVLDGAASGNK